MRKGTYGGKQCFSRTQQDKKALAAKLENGAYGHYRWQQEEN
jgi:hypothetical protein